MWTFFSKCFDCGFETADNFMGLVIGHPWLWCSVVKIVNSEWHDNRCRNFNQNSAAGSSTQIRFGTLFAVILPSETLSTHTHTDSIEWPKIRLFVFVHFENVCCGHVKAICFDFWKCYFSKMLKCKVYKCFIHHFTCFTMKAFASVCIIYLNP